MTKDVNKNFFFEEDPGLIGDASVVDRFLKMPKKKSPYPHDALATHLYRLMTLHPKIASRFSSVDLASLSASAKESLLKHINDLLGISNFRLARATETKTALTQKPRRTRAKAASARK